MTGNDAGPGTTTTPTRSTRVPLSASALGLGAIYAAMFWLAVTLAFHWIRPELDPCCSYVSNYGRGDYEWLMQAAFVVFGFGWMAAGISLRRALRETRAAAVLRTLLFIVGFGLLVAGMWRADDLGAAGDPSPEDVFHTVGSLAAFGGLIVFGLLSAWLLRGTRLSGLAVVQLVLGLVTLALFLTFSIMADAGADGFGWWQRALTMVVMPGWLMWLGWRLVLTARAAARRA
ncbi:DUF998 domain-containing protein [Demequina muriae]|uniref:DUF998 domain-containing protein n=1 Tax=Demequina muriae TaxID=3051664 RepID=A0ABT8GFI4_9MICO|nr:DUF998 domain-containing protein [Demequina sp. EGI L300058]MDN4480190.1 DUF998 domain-containing protein [Demequina sp. EGI L300058]